MKLLGSKPVAGSSLNSALECNRFMLQKPISCEGSIILRIWSQMYSNHQPLLPSLIQDVSLHLYSLHYPLRSTRSAKMKVSVSRTNLEDISMKCNPWLFARYQYLPSSMIYYWINSPGRIWWILKQYTCALLKNWHWTQIFQPTFLCTLWFFTSDCIFSTNTHVGLRHRS